MSERIPDWLEQPRLDPKLPDWLTGAPVVPERRRDALPVQEESKALLLKQFEVFLPRILEMICEGYTLANAIKELPIKIDAGAFMRWLKKKPEFHELYKEAKEVRTEAWAGEIIRHAEGKNADGSESMADTSRSRLIVDTFKWLMSADNRKQYGDTKTIEVNQSISITAALAQAQSRVAQVIDDDVIDAVDYKMLPSGSDEDDEGDQDD